MITLRDYQQDLFKRIHEAMRRRVRRALVVAPTGAGKTVLFSYLANKCNTAGSRIYILVHRQELVTQTSRTLRGFGVPHGIIAGGITPDMTHLVQVAMVQTLANRKLPAPKLIVVDEAHHATSGSYAKVVAAYPDAFVIGFTATPERLDGRGLSEVFDEILPGPPVSWLMDQGFLSRTKYYAPPMVADYSGVHTSKGDYNKGEAALAMTAADVTGDCLRHYRKLSDGEPAVAFCCTVDHAKQVAADFRNAGIPASTIDGEMTREARTDVVTALGDGRIKVLTSCEIINEGFDLPIVTTAILLRKTKSLALHLQQIGRVLRTHEGKPHAIVIDHVGNLLEHGIAEDDREWSLDGRKKKKAGESKSPHRQCKGCYAMYSISKPSCPECGWTPSVMERLQTFDPDTDLVELQRTPLKELLTAATTKADLKRIAEVKNYKKGWVWHQSREMGLTA